MMAFIVKVLFGDVQSSTLLEGLRLKRAFTKLRKEFNGS